MTSLSCALVGLPNVGKSTLFNALTQSALAQTGNYPFCTITPQEGSVFVQDERLEQIAVHAASERVVPATLRFCDIAGLVKGAASGEGLGNQFLSHIRASQAILHVVRCFTDPNIPHIHDKIDPLRDIDIVETELLLSDMESAEKHLKKEAKGKEALRQGLEKCLEQLSQGIGLASLSIEEKALIKPFGFLTVKPVLYVCNVAGMAESVRMRCEVESLAKKIGGSVFVIAAELETQILQLPPSEQKAFLQDEGFQESGLNRLIKAAYSLLSLRTFFTIDSKETRAWTIKDGLRAEEAAGKIHTDFKCGFIKAEVISYEHFIKHNGLKGAKSAGHLRQEGKDYRLQEGDIIRFLFNV